MPKTKCEICLNLAGVSGYIPHDIYCPNKAHEDAWANAQ